LLRDPAVAKRVGAVLCKEIEAGQMTSDAIRLRAYLCRALGEFHVADAMPPLIVALQTGRDEAELDVRLCAVRSIAALASRVDPADASVGEAVLAELLKAADSQWPTLRERAAFALGVLGGTEAEARLVSMLGDQAAEVRYNAATGLARHGNSAGIEVLIEMLDLTGAGNDYFSPQRIQLAALEATAKLAQTDRVDLGTLPAAVERLTLDEADDRVRRRAAEVFDLCKTRSGASAD